jgi:hypothetical protein
VVIFNTYLTPTQPLNETAKLQLNSALDAIAQQFEKVDTVVVGDLNDSKCTWSEKHLQARGLRRIGDPILATHKHGKALDQYWTSSDEVHQLEVINDVIGSDHKPIVITIPRFGPILKKPSVIFSKKEAQEKIQQLEDLLIRSGLAKKTRFSKNPVSVSVSKTETGFILNPVF